MMRFANRRAAGCALAERLSSYAGRNDVVVLALPRGGVPVAFEIASALAAPLDVLIVRKLGVPGHEELAMGAIASGGVQVINDDVVRSLNLSTAAIEQVAAREQQEIERRERAYRDERPAAPVAAKTVILVDDGIATGATMRAAVSSLRQRQPAQIIVAVPTAARDAVAQLSQEADEVVCLATPEPYFAVGYWYVDFAQTSDDEVRELLSQ